MKKRKTRPGGFRIESWWCVVLMILVAIAWHSDAGANDLSSPPPGASNNPKVHAQLHNARQQMAPAEAGRYDQQQIQEMAARGIALREDGKVLVEIIGPDNDVIVDMVDFDNLESIGLETGVYTPEVSTDESPGVKSVERPLTASGNRAEAWLPLDRIDQAAAALPEGYLIKPVGPNNYDDVTGQGPAVTNSDSYAGGGYDGDGLTIAIIDGGFYGLSAATTNGDAPSAYTAINYSSTSFQDSGDGTHGTGCVEALFDHAPDATYRIYKIDSVSDLATAVTSAIAAGVDIISYSQSRYNLGWGDNSGTACAAANNASNNGIIFFTSAGNRAQSHYQASFTDTDGDGWHEFSSGDETINLSISPDADGGYYLSWSNAATDLDFYLYDASWSVVASSATNSDGVFEEFYYDNPGATATFHLSVYRRSGSTSTEIEIFSHNAGTWNEHIVAEGSTTSPSNATGSRVISVGAVYHGSYSQPNGSSVIKSYSSRGPSNSGMTLPDITGPTDTTGYTYPSGFGGTSCATPNVAGAAAALWSSNTALSGYAIQWLCKEQADLWRDWGTSGYDNTYGKGGIFLTDYRYGTRWAARSYPGTADDPSVPYYTIQGATGAVPDNGRLLIFGTTYPETVLMGSTGNALMVEPVANSGSVILGD